MDDDSWRETLKKLADLLSYMYDVGLADKRGVVMVHLFGILHGSDLREANITPGAVVREAKIPKGYSTAVGAGMSLAPYVKPGDKAHDLIERGRRQGFQGTTQDDVPSPDRV